MQELIIDRNKAIIEELPDYGYRRVTQELRRRGVSDNYKKLLRIMQQQGLTRKPRRHWVRTTDSNPFHRCTPNVESPYHGSQSSLGGPTFIYR
jgi:hypothetical protein